MASTQADDEATLEEDFIINNLTGQPMPNPKSANYLPTFRRMYHAGGDPDSTYVNHHAYSPSLRPDQTHLGRPYDHSHLRRTARQGMVIPDLGIPGQTRQAKFVLGEAAARNRMRNALAAQNYMPSPPREEMLPEGIFAENEDVEDGSQDVENMREDSAEIPPSALRQRRSIQVKRQVQTAITLDAGEGDEANDSPEEVVISKPRLGPSALKRKHRPSQRAKVSSS